MAKKLEPKEIAKHLMSDVPAYKEFIEEMIASYLEENDGPKNYWDAWFRGATGKDLEDADKGKEFQS